MAISELLAAGVHGYRARKRRKKLPWLYAKTPGHQPWRSNAAGLVAHVHASHAADQALNRHLAVCAASATLATVGVLVYPPVGLLSVPGIIYVAVPIVHETYRELQDEGKVSMTMVYSMMILGSLALGRYVAMSLAAGLRLFSQKLLLRTEDRSRQSLIHVLGEQPRYVWLLREQREIHMPLEALQVGDIVVVRAGETVPVDGTIAEGMASIDQRVLTGESQPVERGIGDQVFASTTVLSGKIGISVEKAGQDTAAAQIAEVLNRTADFRSSVQLWAQTISDKSALLVLTLSAVTLPFFGPVSALSLLYASFGYDLRITAPLSALNFLRLASRRGVLIKDGRALEVLHNVDIIIFDKTGTLTLEQPRVGKIYACCGLSANAVLTYAAAAEYRQTHPIARAILQEAARRHIHVPGLDEATYAIGYGIRVHVANHTVRVGSARFMELEHIPIPPDLQTLQHQGQAQGYSYVYVALGERLGGVIELHATVRPEARGILQALQQRHLELYVISGDQEEPTRKLAHELGLAHYVANALPENKAALIERLQSEGKKVCFVGDGINDAIALKQADVSLSLRGAATVATDTAQMILMDQTLHRLDQVFELARQLKANMCFT